MDAIWAIPYFLGAVALHAWTARWPRGNPIVKFLGGAGAVGLALWCHLLLCDAELLALSAGLLAYALACEMYLFLFTMAASSVSARILLLLRRKQLSLRQIEELYEPAGMVERRVARLIEAGLLERSGKEHRVTVSGRRILKIYLALRSFCRHEADPATDEASSPWQPEASVVLVFRRETGSPPVRGNRRPQPVFAAEFQPALRLSAASEPLVLQ